MPVICPIPLGHPLASLERNSLKALVHGGADIEGEGCLELEHVVGFSANFKQTFHAHPTLHNKTVAR